MNEAAQKSFKYHYCVIKENQKHFTSSNLICYEFEKKIFLDGCLLSLPIFYATHIRQ